MKKDLLTLNDMDRDDLTAVLDLAARFKCERGRNRDFLPLAGKSIGLIFAKSSTRTRVSFEVGVNELGGYPLYLDQSRMQLGRGETVSDTAHVLSRFLHGIVIRTFAHSDVEELAREADIPVINALTDSYHPCQILADIMTIKEHSGYCDERIKLAFYGDGRSNIANSLMLAGKLCGMRVVISAPEEERPDAAFLGNNVTYEPDPLKAAEGVDYFYSDVWVSMGFEEDRERRMRIFRPYQVNERLFDNAAPGAKFMHCLPAHRGEEVSAGIMDDHARSIVFDEAENRLHVQKAVMAMLMK